MNHPLIGQGLLAVQSRQPHGLKPLCSQHIGEIPCPEENLLLLLFLLPSFPVHVDGTGGHNQMHMRMVIEITLMGMQHSMGTGAASQLRIPAGKAVNRLPGGFQQQIIGNALVGPEHSPQLCRHRGSDHEIVDRQEFGLLPIELLPAFVVLAVGAAAVAAGMGQGHLIVTAIAFQHNHAAVFIAATTHGLQCPVMAWQKLLAVTLFKIAAVAIDQISKEDHQMSSQRMAKPATRSLMRSLACWRFTSVRWV